jgi:hypothetical protein
MPEKRTLPAREQVRTIVEIEEFDARPERGADSPEFTRNKHMLVKRLDLPCWVCGSRDNREVHHIHEHAQWVKLDPEKVKDTLLCFDVYGYSHHMIDQPVTSPDDIRNLVVLCGHLEQDGQTIEGGHHRGKGVSAHGSTWDLFFAQRAVKAGEEVTHAVTGMNAHKAAAKKEQE